MLCTYIRTLRTTFTCTCTVGVKKHVRFRPVPFYVLFCFLPVFNRSVPSRSIHIRPFNSGRARLEARLGWILMAPRRLYAGSPLSSEHAQALGLESKTGGMERADQHAIFLPVHYQYNRMEQKLSIFLTPTVPLYYGVPFVSKLPKPLHICTKCSIYKWSTVCNKWSTVYNK